MLVFLGINAAVTVCIAHAVTIKSDASQRGRRNLFFFSVEASLVTLRSNTLHALEYNGLGWRLVQSVTTMDVMMVNVVRGIE